MEKRKILLIEDSPSQALFSKTILEEVGYDVLMASTGEQGSGIIEDQSPQIILVNGSILDAGTRRMVKSLRKKAQNYIPILLLAGDANNFQDGQGAGADISMQTSFQQRELLTKINRLVKVKEIMDKLVSSMASENDSYQVLKQITLYDHLTNIYNRDYFLELLEREYAMAQRYHTPIACVICDLDNFRDFNQAYGYSSGDDVLRGIADVLKGCIRMGDIIARFGEDEFVLLLPMTGAAPAKDLAERLRCAVENARFTSPAGELSITMSFGVAGIPAQKALNTAEMLELAHRAVYRAKLFGRNRVEILLGSTHDLSTKRW